MSDFINAIWFGFWVFLPAGIANMTPSIANKIPGLNRWNTPIDFGKSYRGKRLLGNNKRWRGLVLGTIVAGIVGGLYYFAWTINHHKHFNDEILIYSVILGMIMGFGALVGDAVESFFKRQAKIKPGHTWFPFDQIDYIVGGLLLSYPFIRYTAMQILSVFVVYFGLHLIVNYVGFLLKFKDRPI